MNDHLIIIGLLSVVLVPRHLLQLYFDWRNRHRSVLLRATTPAAGLYLVGAWLMLHVTAFYRLAQTSVLLETSDCAGCMLVILGAVLGIVALLTLNNSYHFDLAVVAGAKLVTGGIYSVVRHPLRLSLALETLGATILGHRILLGFVWLLLLLLQIWRTIDEEPMLIEQWGSAYTDYQSAVPAANFVCGVQRTWGRWWAAMCETSWIAEGSVVKAIRRTKSRWV